MADRSISSSMVSSESLNNLSDQAFRLLWNLIASDQTDAWGRRDAALGKLRADCIPRLNWTDGQLLASIRELEREGIVELYEVDGRYFLQVSNWDRYQRTIARLRRGKSRHPDPPSSGERAANERRTSGGRDPLILGSCSSEVIQPSAVVSVQRAADADHDFQAEEEPGDGESIGWFVSKIPHATARTPVAIRTVVRKYRLPPAALHAALEEISHDGVANPPGLFVAKLKEWGESGRYAA